MLFSVTLSAFVSQYSYGNEWSHLRRLACCLRSSVRVCNLRLFCEGGFSSRNNLFSSTIQPHINHQTARHSASYSRTTFFTGRRNTKKLALFSLRPWLLAPDALSCRILQHRGLQRSLPPPKGGRRSPLVMSIMWPVFHH